MPAVVTSATPTKLNQWRVSTNQNGLSGLVFTVVYGADRQCDEFRELLKADRTVKKYSSIVVILATDALIVGEAGSTRK